jgi:DNA-binding LacI/PurR family transcriptional regulator
VAKAAGVSRATVSYVLNDVPGRRISPGTRERVLDAARRLGHVPSAPGRLLRMGRSDIVLVLVRDYNLGYTGSQILRSLDAALAERGYVILLDRYDPVLRTMLELWQRVSPALVVAMGGLPITEESALELSSERFLRLEGTVPNVRIGTMQAAHLAERGHSRLGYARHTRPAEEMIASERLHGLSSEWARMGLDDPLVQVVDPDDPRSAESALDAWMAVPDLTAIAAHNDELALLICASLLSRGLTPGVDMAVMGVDDIPLASMGLTTVRIDVPRWSSHVVEAIFALLDDRPVPPIGDDIVSVVVRKTA